MQDLLAICGILLAVIGYFVRKAFLQKETATSVFGGFLALLAGSIILILAAAMIRSGRSSLKVCDVSLYSEAEKGGFRRGQEIEAVDGRPVRGLWDMFHEVLRNRNQKVSITVSESGRRREMSLLLGDMAPDLLQVSRSDLTALFSGLQFECGPALMVHLPHPYIYEQEKSMRQGLRIFQVAGTEPMDSGHLREIIDSISNETAFPISILLNGQERVLFANFALEDFPGGYPRNFFQLMHVGALRVGNRVAHVPPGIHGDFFDGALQHFNGQRVFPSIPLHYVDFMNEIEILFYFGGPLRLYLTPEAVNRIKGQGFEMYPELALPFVPEHTKDPAQLAFREMGLVLKKIVLGGANKWAEIFRTWRFAPKRWELIEDFSWKTWWYWLFRTGEILLISGLWWLLFSFGPLRKFDLRYPKLIFLCFIGISLCFFINEIQIVRIIR